MQYFNICKKFYLNYNLISDTLSKHGVSISDKSLASHRDVESLKLQYDKAIQDIQILRK